jgi:3'-phosphoadenosine 5'-phosphosulfate sulfotransferase (PAPS reductase)/FAD synthetase
VSGWDAWVATWRMHARGGAFRSRLERAARVVQDAVAIEGVRWVACNSGGKDSVALLAVLHAAGVRMPVVHAWCEINAPGMDEVARASCAKLGIELEEIEPQDETGAAIDVFAWLEALPHDQHILEPDLLRHVDRLVASGNMLVAYQYARGFTGAMSGMRAEESKGRRMNRKIRGHTYQLGVDKHWMCNPLGDWTARDVFAAAVAFDLPIHPHYQALFERFGVSPESPASRVDSLLVDDSIAARGALEHARVIYPELWSRLVAARPELRRSGGA